MEYAEVCKSQMAQAKAAFPSIDSASQQIRTQRTFDSVRSALDMVYTCNRRIGDMLERIVPREREQTTSGIALGNLANPASYVSTLDQLQSALNELSTAISELEKHI